MGFLSKIKRIYLQKTGKIKKKWPIVVRVYRKVGNNYKLEKVTRGRTLDEKDGKLKTQILDSPLESKDVPYEYFTNRSDNIDELEIVRHTRKNFSPLKRNIKVKENSEEDSVENEEKVIEKIYSLEEMKKTLVADWENKVEVTKTDDEHWIHDDRVQALIVYIGAGIFFVMLGIGYSKVVTKPLLEAINQREAAQNILPVLAFAGRNQARKLKEKVF